MEFSVSHHTQLSQESAQVKPRGRLAPSPTGLLHLGNAWSFLWAWLWAKSSSRGVNSQGSIVLRMEDIDPQRAKAHYVSAIEDDLRWLGLLWDGDTVYQSQRQNVYEQTLHVLREQGFLYPCYCTRKELRTLAGAPHMDDYGAPYPGICATLNEEQRAVKQAIGRKPAWRMACLSSLHNSAIAFTDALYGEQVYDLQDIGGDFALCRSDGVVAYQLAVVVDDAAQGINQVLRGADILVSTPRQIFLQNCLGLAHPQYAHVPLLLDDTGQRLAKRHSALSLQALRHDGVAVERILGLLAYLAGYVKSPELRPVCLAELQDNFSFSQYVYLQKPQERMVTDIHRQFLYASS